MTEDGMDDRVREFLDRCREGGFRVTPQRVEILRMLLEVGGHPSAEDLYSDLRGRMPGLSVDTVYRTLATFQELGIVRRLEVLDDRGRFELNSEPHHHLICTRCRRVWDVEWSELDELDVPSDAHAWGEVDRPHAELRGICQNCLAQGEEKEARSTPRSDSS